MIHFKKEPDIPIPEITAVYYKNEYDLDIGYNNFASIAKYWLPLERLTLSFSPEMHIFICIDGYVNHERWEQKNLAVPPIDEVVALRCTEEFDINGIGKKDPGPEHYTFSSSNSLLLIRVGSGTVSQYIRCLSCVVAGLGKEGELIELWIENLKFIE